MSMAARICFALTGLFILLGGPRHPRGTMVEMLAHPDWVMSHVLLLIGFVALFAALLLLPRAASPGPGSGKWLPIATVGTLLQCVEMALHTVAVVDAEHLAAGQSTPVLATHLWMSVIIYPIFGAALASFIVVSARERYVGSRWFAWLGAAGAVAHGLSAPLVVGLHQEWATVLFPMLMLVALWAVLAAIWPGGRRAPAPITT